MFKINSLKTNIIIYLVLFTSIPLIIASSIILYTTYQSKKEVLFNQHLQILKQVENDIDRNILNIEEIGFFVKENFFERKERLLQGLIGTQKTIEEIYILDSKGLVKDFQTRVKSNLFIGYDFSNTKHYLEIAHGKSTYWSDAYLSNTTNKPVISYSIKIDDDNIAIFIIDLASINTYAQKFQSGDGSTMVRIMDNNGVFLANPDKPEFVLQQKSILNMSLYKNIISKGYKYQQIIFQNTANNTLENIGVYGVTKKLHWYVVVKERYEYIFQTYFNIMYFLVVFIMSMIFLSIIVAIRLSKSILKPLDAVSLRMENIAQGKDTEDIDKNDYKELKKLIDSSFIMKNKIQKRENSLHLLNQHLEDKVQEKTKELQLLNQNLDKKVEEEIAKNMEKELHILESSKMIQMGEMIGNIAHQWRQPLSVISTAASGMKLQKEFGMLEDEKFNYYCDSIVENSEHLSETIDIFRNFIKEKKEKSTIIVQNRIDISLKIIASTLAANHIKLINNIDYTNPIKLVVVVGELSQVIINIINNAKDILLERKIQDAWIRVGLEQDSNFVTISIEDNAGGVPSEIISKIFDPYFTTKHKSQGTGLGLHMGYKIVTESLGGQLKVSNSTNGAIFTIKLPLS
jgi:C4-dicarboxylate-specific signal transduction histidine kinase